MCVRCLSVCFHGKGLAAPPRVQATWPWPWITCVRRCGLSTHENFYLTRSICYRLPVGLQVLDNRQGSYGTEHPVEFTQLRLTSDFESVCVTAPLSLLPLSSVADWKGEGPFEREGGPLTHYSLRATPLQSTDRKERDLSNPTNPQNRASLGDRPLHRVTKRNRIMLFRKNTVSAMMSIYQAK